MMIILKDPLLIKFTDENSILSRLNIRLTNMGMKYLKIIPLFFLFFTRENLNSNYI